MLLQSSFVQWGILAGFAIGKIDSSAINIELLLEVASKSFVLFVCDRSALAVSLRAFWSADLTVMVIFNV